MSMAEMITAVLRNTSRAELRLIRSGDVSVAQWIAEHTLPLLTPSQAESVALRVVEAAR